jgi:hypothetical protein
LVASGSNVNLTTSNVDAFGYVYANRIRVGYPGVESDEITVFHNMSNWNLTSPSNVISVGHSTFSRMNNITTISFRCSIVVGQSNRTFNMSLPIPPRYTTAHTVVFSSVESGDDLTGYAHLYATSNDMRVKCMTLNDGNWYVSGVLTYETAP